MSNNLSLLTLSKSLKSKISSETQDNLLNVAPAKSKGELHTSNTQWHKISISTQKNGINAY